MSERKRIAVIVEWEGACSEWQWIDQLSHAVEGQWSPRRRRLRDVLRFQPRMRPLHHERKWHDSNCRVTRMVPLTDLGTTGSMTDDELRESILRIEGERDTHMQRALLAIDTDDRDDGSPYNSTQMREIARRALAGEDWSDV